MKVIVPLLTALIAAGATYFYLQSQAAPSLLEAPDNRVEIARRTVEVRLDDLQKDIRTALDAFAEVLQSDRNFSVKLALDKETNAQEVTEAASKYLKPLRFSFLDITDASGTVLSCGQFPANVGSNAIEKIKALESVPRYFKDSHMGRSVLSLQAKKSFQLLEIPLTVTGGIIIDEPFLRRLGEYASAKVLLKEGMSIKGMSNIQSISEIQDGKIIINDHEYEAASIDLSVSDGNARSLIVIPEHQFK